MSHRRPTAPLVAILLAAALPALAGVKGPHRRFDAEPDSGLVFFVRPGIYVWSANTSFVFAGDRLLGVLDNSTYFAARLPPGRHEVWTRWHPEAVSVHVAPGGTYYFNCHLSDLALVDSLVGEDLIAQVGHHVAPTPKELETGARIASTRMTPRPAYPAETRTAPDASEHPGQSWLPRWTEIRLELLESIASGRDATGAAVKFRVAEDVVVEGDVVVSRGTLVAGTIRESSAAPGGPRGGLKRNFALVDGGRFDKKGVFHEATAAKPGSVGGVLDVAVASVTANDDTVLPVIGLPADGDSERAFARSGRPLGFGVYGKFALPGLEAYHLRGDVVAVATRADTWLHPVPPRGDESTGGAAVPPADVTLVARATGSVDLVPDRGSAVAPVLVVIESDSPVRSATITSVGGRAPSTAPAPARLDAGTSSTTVTFDGWSVARLLHRAAAPGDNLVEIRGELADGRTFVALAELVLTVRTAA